MISISLLIGFISVKLLHDHSDQTASDNMLNICENKKEELNNILSSIEQSVNIISNISESKIASLDLFGDDYLYNEYIQEFGGIGFDLDFNSLAWFSFEEITRQIADEMEINW